MRYHYISDSHVHSDCSFDGTDPVMMICERAAALGLYSIAVTDHCECDIYYKEGFDRSVVQSFFETRKARAVFYGRLQVYAGIELGQPNQALIEYLQEWKRNDNLPEIIEFYGHNSRKISCDYYIDDRMLLPENAKA